MHHEIAGSKTRASEHLFLDSNTQSEGLTTKDQLFLLNEALISERKALQKLRKELKEERYASATAANEAMAMIARLQEEKAAALMEVRQYKCATEQREAYNQEAIIFLKEALLVKGEDLRALQKEIDAYKWMLFQIQTSGTLLENGHGILSIEDNGRRLLVDDLQEEPSGFLGGSTLDRQRSSCDDAIAQISSFKEAQCSNWIDEHDSNCSMYFVWDDAGINQQDCSNGVKNDYIGGSRRGSHQDVASRRDQIHLFQDGERQKEEKYNLEQWSPLGAQVNGKLQKTDISQEQNLEAVSMSILARVKSLEERFENLRADHIPEFGRNHKNWQHEPNFCAELNAEKTFQTVAEDSSYRRGQIKCNSVSQELSLEKPGNDKDMKHISMISGGEITTEDWRPIEFTTDSDREAESTESIHDVYEIQYEISNQHASSIYDGESTSQFNNPDAVGVSLSPLSHVCQIKSEVGETLAAKLGSLDVTDAKRTIMDEDVHHLKLRLQALESERLFMKEAIESLRKENMELKLLQEIAQHLQELKGDVNKFDNLKGRPEVHFPFLSYLKNLLGIQCSSQSIKAKLGCPLEGVFKAGSSEIKLRGLHDLLLMPSTTTCVTRAVNVKLPSNKPCDKSGCH